MTSLSVRRSVRWTTLSLACWLFSAFGCSTTDESPESSPVATANATRDAGQLRDGSPARDQRDSGGGRDGAARGLVDAEAQRDAAVDGAAEAAIAVTRRPDPGAEPRYGERPTFCDRAGDDDMRALFCGEEPAKIGSLSELYEKLELHPAPGYSIDPEHAPVVNDPNTLINTIVVISHSTSLSGKLVSPINPRMLVIGNNSVVTYQRGVQQVELLTLDRKDGGFNFFLLNFRQACNEREEGCSPGDLYTPRVEQDWLSVAAREDEDLRNTPLDCRQCHQRGTERPIMLMRELESPWTHFFELHPDDAPGPPLPGVRGRDLVRDYLNAKGKEGYAAVPMPLMRHTSAVILQNLMEPQPLLFDAPLIEEQRWPYVGEAPPTKPLESAFWEDAYAAFKRGDQLALPYLEPRATDPDKQAKLTEAYSQYREGKLSADDLPDLGDIFPDDAMTRARIGLQNEPGATPAQALVQVCGSCHNDVLDQTISRALFSIDLSRMDRVELDIAIERLERAKDAPGVMPPPEFRQLDPDARARLIAYLRDNKRSQEDDALLKHAAQAGMKGGGE